MVVSEAEDDGPEGEADVDVIQNQDLKNSGRDTKRQRSVNENLVIRKVKLFHMFHVLNWKISKI